MFLFEGVWITNPFLDESGRFPVDPIDYYGLTEKDLESTKEGKDK